MTLSDGAAAGPETIYTRKLPSNHISDLLIRLRHHGPKYAHGWGTAIVNKIVRIVDQSPFQLLKYQKDEDAVQMKVTY